jgi:hypothetical protein
MNKVSPDAVLMEYVNRRPSRHLAVNKQTDNLQEKIQFDPLRTDGVAISMKFCTLFKRMWRWGLQAPLTECRTDFESENGFERVLQLATELAQVLIDQSYSLTPQWPIRTKPPPQIIGPICPLD